MRELNVIEIVLRERHPLIFKTFDELPGGDAFVLVNDHDPIPLLPVAPREGGPLCMGIPPGGA